MPEPLLFPRLPIVAARALLTEIQGKTVSELSDRSAARNGRAIFGATGGTRVQESNLEDLRREMLRVASDLGFPDTTRKDISMSFDHSAASVLASRMPIAAGEASRDDVWAFLTLVLMPDIATWRFPDQQERRFLGGPRNAFQRIWWRARMLRDLNHETDAYWLLKLQEDALVGLMERPALSSHPKVALAIAKAIHGLAAKAASNEREAAWRAAYKRIRQRIVLVNLEFLAEADLRDLVARACLEN